MSDAASEIARLRAALAASEARAEAAESELAQTRSVVSTSEAMIKHLRLEIAKLRREQYGHSSERRARLIDQMELQLEELEAAATEDEIAAEKLANPNRHLAGWQGILQADAYGGYNDLYRADRDPGPAESALCWSHARRKFFELADIKGNARKGKPAHDISPIALEAIARIDAIFDSERGINGLTVAERQAARHQRSKPLVEELHGWLRAERGRMSKHNPVAKAIDYMFKAERWLAFTRFLEDGRVCLTNNAAERALRGIALGRKSWLFAGSERGGDRAAFMY